MSKERVLVAGGGGFIGGHMVKALIEEGYKEVIAIDIKPLNEWFQLHKEADNRQTDLSIKDNCHKHMDGVDVIYNYAADMGGMGFIEKEKTRCMLNVLINTHTLMAAHNLNIQKYIFPSSACVYRTDRQQKEAIVSLGEEDAYPAMAEDGYGWEKLFSERMCRHFREDFGVQTRVARLHNVYGPFGTYAGGREKAPAALCRKVISAKLSGTYEIEIWGSGNQVRSFMYIDDCLEGIRRLSQSDYFDPLNIGSSEAVTINQLVSIIEEIAGIKLRRRYNHDAPKGVGGRNSDNALIKKLFDWEPDTPLRVGMEKTYKWTYDRMRSE